MLSRSDLEQFWKDDALAHEDNCFSPHAPQVALGIRMSDECVFAELGEEGEPWGYTPRERRLELNKRYNGLAERIVGRRLLAEELPAPDARFPHVRMIGEVFGGEYVYYSGNTWLKSRYDTPTALEAQLDAIDKMDFRGFVLPSGWEAEKKRIFETFGIRPQPFRNIRGPVTLACSIFGAENFVYLYYDAPELFSRFSRAICDVILKYIRLFSEESGYGCAEETRPRGFQFNDDDCALLTPEMYEAFGYPVLKEVFGYASPAPGDERYQHSDSDMGHLLPILGSLGLTGCNFGPKLSVEEIRRHCPRARIDGQLAPFTFMGNDRKEIVAEVERDCKAIKAIGGRGLNLATAGSINNGSLLRSMLAVMEGILEFGRY
ncbi:MAG: hypothetical protein LBL83_01425 [Clostridiales bacterium]|jgi:uroporphyrinogen decarboxylase|nr:hypothetical protein [Clostridiales bacterium]